MRKTWKYPGQTTTTKGNHREPKGKIQKDGFFGISFLNVPLGMAVIIL